MLLVSRVDWLVLLWPGRRGRGRSHSAGYGKKVHDEVGGAHDASLDPTPESRRSTRSAYKTKVPSAWDPSLTARLHPDS